MTEFRPRGFQTMPPVIKNLLIINVLIFIAQLTFGQSGDLRITSMFGLHDIRSYYFKVYQLITYMFLHGGYTHILFNMIALWMFGSALENYWGSKRFLIFYMICGVGAAICDLAVMHIQLTPIYEQATSFMSSPEQREDAFAVINSPTIGASGAIFGCLAAFGYLFPNAEMLLIPIPFPVKAKWVVIGYGALELYSGFANSAGDNVAHWAHLGGALFGILLVMYWNRTNRRNFY